MWITALNSRILFIFTNGVESGVLRVNRSTEVKSESEKRNPDDGAFGTMSGSGHSAFKAESSGGGKRKGKKHQNANHKIQANPKFKIPASPAGRPMIEMEMPFTQSLGHSVASSSLIPFRIRQLTTDN